MLLDYGVMPIQNFYEPKETFYATTRIEHYTQLLPAIKYIYQLLSREEVDLQKCVWSCEFSEYGYYSIFVVWTMTRAELMRRNQRVNAASDRRYIKALERKSPLGRRWLG